MTCRFKYTLRLCLVSFSFSLCLPYYFYIFRLVHAQTCTRYYGNFGLKVLFLFLKNHSSLNLPRLMEFIGGGNLVLPHSGKLVERLGRTTHARNFRGHRCNPLTGNSIVNRTLYREQIYKENAQRCCSEKTKRTEQLTDRD